MVVRGVRVGTLMLTLASAACSARERPPEERQGPDDSRALQETATAAAEKLSTQAPAPVGTWTLAPPPGADRPGIQLTIAIDSARSGTLWGRMTHYFAGNMGIDASRLAPFEGTLSADGRVEFAVEWSGGQAPGFAFAGTLTGDTITLSRLKIGPDEVPSSLMPRYLVRERR